MKVALGFKAHSGWAALVVIGRSGKEFEVIDRRRVELVDKTWEKQPYHAAEGLALKEAQKLIKQGTEAAYQRAQREMRSTAKSLGKHGHEILACAVLVPNPMPEWNAAEILAVHFRMHKAEGVLFPEALANAAEKCGLNLIRIPEKQLDEVAEKRLAAPLTDLMKQVMKLGKTVGPPWGKDQKSATLAALIGLRVSSGLSR
ncbi:MAG TPA: hypothetical protein VHR36_09860 [Pyrinomonadaceae bacterium]|nr:hypothetical protein [Pyrinomonadaceae bacterium]